MRRLPLSLALLGLGCASPPSAGPNLDLSLQAARPAGFQWADLGPEAFAKARSQNRLLILHGAAQWCHWCHVMEETTYRDAKVAALVRARFVPVRVDVDARPDIEERYSQWGWPATILLDGQGREIAKYRGYMPPAQLLELLQTALQSTAIGPQQSSEFEPGPASAPVSALPWLARRLIRDMDEYYDHRNGGWGTRQKLAVGANSQVEALRAQGADEDAQARLLEGLRAQRPLLDPVDGGIYQYSTGGTWTKPHYEKLMTYQAAALEAYATAFGLTGAPDMAADASNIVKFLDHFMTSEAGTYYTNQDADVGAHEPTTPLLAGKDYYGLGRKGREQIAQPWVDTHVYGYENGLAIAALVTAYEATKDLGLLQRARRAADAISQSHLLENGAVLHDAERRVGPYFLADAAAMCRAFARLAQHDEGTRYRDLAVRIAEYMQTELLDTKVQAYFASSRDPDAQGVFAIRRHAVEHNIVAARAFAALAKVTPDKAYRAHAQQVLAAIATPAAMDAQGRMIGAMILALSEAGIQW